MALKTVPSFQTSDKSLFTDKLLALTHEQGLELRGIIQAKHTGNSNTILISDAARIIAANGPAIAEILSKYKTAIGRAKKSLSPAVAAAVSAVR